MSLVVKKLDGREPEKEIVYDLDEIREENKNYALVHIPQYKLGSIGPFVKENGKWIYIELKDRQLKRVDLPDGKIIKREGVELKFHEKA